MLVDEKLQRAPVGRFKQLTVALVTLAGKLIWYVAVDPAVTDTVVEGSVGALAEAPAGSTSNCKMSDVPPPGAGVCTLIAVAPAVVISAAVTLAVSCAAFTNCVASAEVPQNTVELGRKFAPLTVMVKAAPPASAMAGVMLPKKGDGLGLTVKATLAVAVV